MFFRFGKQIFLFFIFLVLCSCFGAVDKRGSVYQYKKGVVFTEGGAFRIGTLPSEWKRSKFSYKAILFTHKLYAASVSVSSFCKGSFDDAPLEVLTHQLSYGITHQKQNFQQQITLNERSALRTGLMGELDGALIFMDTVVLKMNECVFDFVYVSKPPVYKKGVHDFEKLFKGFHYISGPNID